MPRGLTHPPSLLPFGAAGPSRGRDPDRPLPDARLVVFDAAHVPHTSDPDGVARELTAFADAVAEPQMSEVA
jgi:pimeloyl-ACP methyl ester carboxylesterase